MSDIVIQADNLGKSYQIGEREPYLALRDLLARAASAPARMFVPRKPSHSNGNHAAKNRSRIWALKDASFEIRQGEIVGLVGRNGAGKSTLLKILSRITKPTIGWAQIRGRVGSLLEVGTGFHPELTGRENVYLSGAILGMGKREITRKFDEIVAFAEVEDFIGTPVKHYSSGMYVRLAFSVAAHLEPEILLVDEVLAVGDASFQKKCLGKMGQVSRGGRTILFVSHNMAAIKALCSRAVLMRQGSIAVSGSVADVVDNYLGGATSGASAKEWDDPSTAPGNENIRLSHVRITPPDRKPVITIETGAHIEIGFENFRKDIHLGCTVYVSNSEGVVIFASGHTISPEGDSLSGFYQLTGKIPGHLLNTGRYSLDVVFGKDQRYVLLRVDRVVCFEVENIARGSNMGIAPGLVRPQLSWSHSFSEGLGCLSDHRQLQGSSSFLP